MNNTEIPIPTMLNQDGEDTEQPGLREELISLAESGDIKYTSRHIRKASHTTLEKIKADYNRKQTEEANEFISDNIISKFSDLMSNLDMISNPDDMGRELQDNKLLKRDLKNIVGYITPYIPMIGLLCGGIIAAKHIVGNRYAESPQQDVGGVGRAQRDDGD